MPKLHPGDPTPTCPDCGARLGSFRRGCPQCGFRPSRHPRADMSAFSPSLCGFVIGVLAALMLVLGRETSTLPTIAGAGLLFGVVGAALAAAGERLVAKDGRASYHRLLTSLLVGGGVVVLASAVQPLPLDASLLIWLGASCIAQCVQGWQGRTKAR